MLWSYDKQLIASAFAESKGKGPSSTRRILTLSRILSVHLLSQAMFSMKSDWAHGCTTSDECSDGGKAVRHSRTAFSPTGNLCVSTTSTDTITRELENK
jgi:hypothetical protein